MAEKISLLYNVQKVLRNYDIAVRGKRPSLGRRLGQIRFIPIIKYVFVDGLDPYVEADYFKD